MMRRWKNGGRGPWRCGGHSRRMMCAIWAGSIRRRSRQFAPRPGRWCAMPRNCTIRCFRSAHSPKAKAPSGDEFFDQLVEQGRAVRREVVDGPALWIAVEQWPAVERRSFAVGLTSPPASLPESLQSRSDRVDDGRQLLVRGRLEISGPTTAARIAPAIGHGVDRRADRARATRTRAASCLRGQFTSGDRATSNGASGGCWRGFIG